MGMGNSSRHRSGGAIAEMSGILIAGFRRTYHDVSMSAIEQTQSGKSSGGKIVALIGCGCLGLILIGVLVVGGIFFGAMNLLKNNDPYRESIAAVQSNPAAAAALGSPIEPGFFLSGNISTENGNGSVDFQIPVSGPNGKGTIRVVGAKAAGDANWTYGTWQLDVEGGDSIPLTR